MDVDATWPEGTQTRNKLRFLEFSHQVVFFVLPNTKGLHIRVGMARLAEMGSHRTVSTMMDNVRQMFAKANFEATIGFSNVEHAT